MSTSKNHSETGAAFTALLLEVFRLNGQLLAAGDKLTKECGLTSARWQVLGAIEMAGCPLSVAQIGRRMGISRQAVQRIANDLRQLGFVTFEDNPDHKRAKLITLSDEANAALVSIGTRQTDWANTLTRGMDPARLEDAIELLRDLQIRCEKTPAGMLEKQE